MIATILSTLLPVIVTLLLGLIAAWHHDFNAKDAKIINRMVLTYAVPISIFVGTVTTTRDKLVQSVPLAVTILVGIVGMYALVFLLSRFVFRLSMGASALVAVTASGPAVPFYGPAILGGLFGDASAIPIAVASIVINITIVPLTIFLLTLESTRKPVPLSASVSPAELVPVTANSVLLEKLVETVRKPLVWAPVLAFVLVLLNVRVPELVGHSLLLLGHASAGVALFAAGIVLAAYKVKFDWRTLLVVLLKNVVQPALVLGGLLCLGFRSPVVPQAVVATSISVMPIVVMLALEYRIGEEYAPSVLLISTLLSLVTVGGFIALTM
ncbi:MAG TPA: AEC family transporter [Bradyrhizobium sp.]|nr:AEC family transporter [Bradyrhizobium sp.]